MMQYGKISLYIQFLSQIEILSICGDVLLNNCGGIPYRHEICKNVNTKYYVTDEWLSFNIVRSMLSIDQLYSLIELLFTEYFYVHGLTINVY